jgi:hypothetical protein
MEHASSTRVDPDRVFTNAQHEVYSIHSGDLSEWESTYITFDY